MDPYLEEKISQWKMAKQQKDFDTSDRLRDELRAAGVDPDKPRNQVRSDPVVQEKLQQWQEAKRNKDFGTADMIRAELRGQGIEPDPAHGGGQSPFADGQQQGGFGGGGGRGMQQQNSMPFQMQMAMPTSNRQYDAQTENDMDQWVEAKQNKDWATADAIRAQLRTRGISPSKERNPMGGSQDELAQWRLAKQSKDFARSDRIRDSLRSQGLDPEKMGSSNPGFGGGGGMQGGQAPPWMNAFKSMANAGQQGQQQFNKRMPHQNQMDATTRDELSQWFAAREEKNFNLSDSIRESLRAKGIEPSDCQKPGLTDLDAGMQEELRQWFEAREQKSFVVADEIRDRLRAQGVEPSQCQKPGTQATSFGRAPGGFGGGARSKPYGSAGGFGGGGAGFDYSTEGQLDEWFLAKQEKNFNKADQIRATLRQQGIEPDEHRPRR